MSQPRLEDEMLKLTGSIVKNHKGVLLGVIMEVTKDQDHNQPEYIILKSGKCFGPGERFFAVPASQMHLKYAKNDTVVLRLAKDDLQFAEGVSFDKCPKPDKKFGKSIYELYQYQSNKAGKSNIKPKEG